MTLRERILAVYAGRTPDVVPYMLDLSHWFYHRHHLPWDLSRAYLQPEYELIDYHHRAGVGFYLPNLGSFYDVTYGDGVVATVKRDDRGPSPTITWTLQTPLGTIRRVRQWEETSYSWAINEFALTSQEDLRILAYALGSRQFAPGECIRGSGVPAATVRDFSTGRGGDAAPTTSGSRCAAWERYRNWVESVGDLGVVYVSSGYSAMGELLSLWMGIEETMLAVADYPEFLHQIVDQINAANLRGIDLLAHSPAEIVLMGDNFSSDIQPPQFFAEWSRPYYAEAVRRLHQAGKYVAVHVDGRLRGLLRALAEIGVDCIDATTPTPMGDLSPQQCRDEAGPDLILSGGVAPNLWTKDASHNQFEAAVRDWLELRGQSPRLIANAGDQVPPGAHEYRIAQMRELVEKFGRY